MSQEEHLHSPAAEGDDDINGNTVFPLNSVTSSSSSMFFSDHCQTSRWRTHWRLPRPRRRRRLGGWPPSAQSILALASATILLLLPSPASGLALIPEFLSYKTCVDAPPSFSGCMSNVTAELGQRVVLNCQVDPRCVVQYLNWYHEDLLGEQRLIKTAKSTNDPYIHIIESVMDSDLGRYYCVIANVVGENQCTAYLSMKSGADATISRSASNFAAVLVLALAAASCRMLKNA